MQHSAGKGIDDRQDIGMPAMLSHPYLLDIHFQHFQRSFRRYDAVSGKGSAFRPSLVFQPVGLLHEPKNLFMVDHIAFQPQRIGHLPVAVILFRIILHFPNGRKNLLICAELFPIRRELQSLFTGFSSSFALLCMSDLLWGCYTIK
jgi:hypothetical protein